MKRYESEKKFSSYLIAGFYILIGCTVCTTLFLYSSSLRNPITRPALFEPEPLEDSTPSLSTEPSTFTSSESLPEEEPSSPSSTSISFTTLNIKSSLHVRIAPGMDSEIIARLAPNTTGHVIERGDEWSLIQTGDITGYVSNRYLKFEESPSP